jgi:hypothetical protein
MTHEPPPLWNQPAPPDPAKRYETLGTACLALSVLELLYCVQRLLSPFFSRSIIELQRSILPETPHGPPVGGMVDAAQGFMAKIALWEAARTVPFLIATGFMIWIAIRLRRGDARALFTARKWTFWALGVVVISVLIQILVTVPATMAYQRDVVDLMPVPAGSAMPFDMKRIMSSVTLVSTLFGMLSGTLLAIAWPIAVYLWAGKLIRETPPAAQLRG